jgi:hypothetical protein
MERYGCHKLEELRTKLRLSEDDLFTHGLERLAKMVPSLYNRLVQSEIWRTFAHVNNWSPSWRYRPGEVTEGEKNSALVFVEEVKRVRQWLDSNRY